MTRLSIEQPWLHRVCHIHMTQDMWYMRHNMWHVTSYMWLWHTTGGHNFFYIIYFIVTKWWSYSVEGLLSMGPTPCHVTHVICHMSFVTCHVSHVTCHMSHVMYHMKVSFIFFYRWLSQWHITIQELKKLAKKNNSKLSEGSVLWLPNSFAKPLSPSVRAMHEQS